jgi:hypothetical protein
MMVSRVRPPALRIRLHPRHAHGYRDATTDEQQITGWFGRGFGWNLAVVTGAPGPDVLDIDHHGPALERLPRVHQDPPGRTGRRRRRLRADPGRRDARLLHRHQPAQLRPGDVSGGAA